MATLLYQGHGSLRVTTDGGKVIYVDPFAGEGYDAPADLILVTHQHHDHNCIGLPAKNPRCVVWQNTDALKDGQYQTLRLDFAAAEAVEAYNHHHKKAECVGYILTVDGVSVYFAGDTGETAEMARMAGRGLDYAVLPMDATYTMDIPETIPEIRRADIPQLARYADKEANPLYPVPRLMDAGELERFYTMVMEEQESYETGRDPEPAGRAEVLVFQR